MKKNLFNILLGIILILLGIQIIFAGYQSINLPGNYIEFMGLILIVLGIIFLIFSVYSFLEKKWIKIPLIIILSIFLVLNIYVLLAEEIPYIANYSSILQQNELRVLQIGLYLRIDYIILSLAGIILSLKI